MHTLVVDDDQIFLTVAKSAVVSLGASAVSGAASVSSAMEYLREHHVDLVILDLNMPAEDGLGMMRLLSEAEYSGGIIIVSGEKASILSSSGHIAEKHGLNLCGILAKPLVFEELRRCFECARTLKAERGKAWQKPELLPKGELKPFFLYQPQVSAVDGTMVGAEALLRGIDENGQMFGASVVLKSARERADGSAAFEALFEDFCEDVSLMRARGFKNRFAINTDAENFEQDGFTQRLLDSIYRHNLEPEGIVIELVEAQLPKDQAWLLEVIARLGIARLDVAMDDFSTGASSFELLRAGAFSEVKLDASIVQNSADDSASSKFIAGVCEMAQAMDIRLVAEGVETEQDRARMSNLGIDILQGYHFSKPVAVDHLQPIYGSASGIAAAS